MSLARYPLKKTVLLSSVLLGSLSNIIFAQADSTAENSNHTVSSEELKDADVPVALAPFYVKTPIVERTSIETDGSKVSKVSTAQWEELNAQDLASALRRIPGVTVSRYGVVGSYGGYEGGAIFIRGHGTGRPGSEISLMTDGIPRFVGVWTHPILDMISIDTAQQLEVYKNPQPVRFGNMAWGAVNAISKRVDQEGSVTNYHMSGGSFNTGAFLLEHGAKQGATDYYFTISDRFSDGHRENADGETRAIYGRVAYAFDNDITLSFQFDANNGWANDPEPQHLSLPITERFETDAYFYLLSLENNNADANGFVKIYYDNGSMDWKQWGKPPPAAAPYQTLHTKTDFDNYGLRTKESFLCLEKGSVDVGFDMDFYGGKSKEAYEFFGDIKADRTTFWNASPYVGIQKTFFDEWKLTPFAGIRYNENRYFDGEWAWQGALTLQKDKTKYFVQYSHSYNYAGVYASIFADRWSVGNSWKDLDAELLDHWEIGMQTNWNDFDFECSFFYDDVSDAIRLSPPPPFPGTIRNYGSYHREGVDGSITWHPDDAWAFFVGACWMNPSRGDLPNNPRWTTSTGAQWNITEKLRFSVDYQYVSEQVVLSPRWGTGSGKIAGYNLLNANLAWTCWETPKKSIQVFLSGENLTDEDYELRVDYPMPGISATLGVRLYF